MTYYEESRQTLRIIDASLNRIGEGLRFLEEIARFTLGDTDLTQRLKTLRHDLLITDTAFQKQLIQYRDASDDVGADLEVPGEEKSKGLDTLLMANARRVQESLRTLEELAKSTGSTGELDTDIFRQARFSIYTIEQELLSRVLRQDKLKRLAGLYVIVDTQMLQGRIHLDVAAQAIRGGARAIQLRDKVQSKKQILPVARELKALCAEHGVLFIINDYLDIALAAGADGLHLGQDDLPVKEARRLLPIDSIVGCSTTNVEQAVEAQTEGADYVAVGAIYPTSSKVSTTTPARVVGLDMIRQVRDAVNIPIVAIGGINKDNVSDVIAAGVDSVAVISAVLGAESPEKASRSIVEAIEVKK